MGDSMASEQLVRLVKEHALQFGEFKLKSGATSHFYLNCRKLTISTHLGLIVDAIKVAVGDIQWDAVGGPAIGADPIVGAFLYSLRESRRGFIVRKQEKDHGLAGL